MFNIAVNSQWELYSDFLQSVNKGELLIEEETQPSFPPLQDTAHELATINFSILRKI